jgi:hypothetical protein
MALMHLEGTTATDLPIALPGKPHSFLQVSFCMKIPATNVPPAPTRSAEPSTRAFTVVDKTDSGRNTLALSNFAAAAAGGFVGMGILPNGYNDLTHAEQHMASEFLQIAIGNVAAEFEPQWGPWVEKIHLPKILPAWWVPQHSHQP